MPWVFFLKITFPWYSGWLVCKNCPKISQWPHFSSKSVIGTMFFEFLVIFLIKMMSHIFIPFLEFTKMSHFRNLPKFAQIPNWWRHTGSCVNFQISGPIFLNSLVISTSEMVQPYFPELTFLGKLSHFRMWSWYKNIPLSASFASMTSSKSEPYPTGPEKRQIEIALVSSKNFIFWCGFFFCWITTDLLFRLS